MNTRRKAARKSAMKSPKQSGPTQVKKVNVTEAMERRMLPNCIRFVEQDLALVLHEDPDNAKKIIRECQARVTKRSRIPLTDFRKLAAKIYDKEHLEIQLDGKAKYSNRFRDLFQHDFGLFEEEKGDKDLEEEKMDRQTEDETIPADVLAEAEAIYKEIDASLDDFHEKESTKLTPKPNKRIEQDESDDSTVDSLIINPQPYDDTMQPQEANSAEVFGGTTDAKQESMEEVEARIVAKIERKFEVLQRNMQTKEKEKEKEQEAAMANLIAQVTDELQSIKDLKKEEFGNLKQDTLELEEKYIDQMTIIKKLQRAIAVAKEETEPERRLQKMEDKANRIYQQFHTNLHSILGESEVARGALHAELQKVKERMTHVDEDSKRIINCNLRRGEEQQHSTKQSIMRSLGELKEDIVTQLEGIAEEKQDELAEAAQSYLDASPAEFGEVIKDALEHYKNVIRTAVKEETQKQVPLIVRTEAKETVPSFLRILQNTTTKYVTEAKVKLKTEIKTATDSINKFADFRETNFKQQLELIKAATVENTKSEVNEAKQACLTTLSDEIWFDSNPLTQQVLKEVKQKLPQLLKEMENERTSANADNEDCRQQLTDLANVLQTKMEQIATEKRIEIQKLGSRLKEDLSQQGESIHARIDTEATQQAGLEANRRVDEDATNEKRWSPINNSFSGRTEGDPVPVTPNPKPTNQYSNAAAKLRMRDNVKNNIRLFNKEFKAAEYQLGILTAESVMTLFHTCFDNLSNVNLPISRVEEFSTIGHALHPLDRSNLNDIDPSFVNAVSSSLYMKIQLMIHEDDAESQRLLALHSLTRDGYKLLYDLLKRHHDFVSDEPYKWGPKWEPQWTPTEYLTKLLYTVKSIGQREKIEKTDKDIVIEMILQASTMEKYDHLTGPLLIEMRMRGQRKLGQYTPSTLASLLDDVYKRNATSRTNHHSDDPMSNLVINKFQQGGKKGKYNMNTRPKVQCELCGTSGHSLKEGQVCWIGAQYFLIMNKLFGGFDETKVDATWYKQLQENAAKYKEYHNPRVIKRLMQYDRSFIYSKDVAEHTLMMAERLDGVDDVDSDDDASNSKEEAGDDGGSQDPDFP